MSAPEDPGESFDPDAEDEVELDDLDELADEEWDDFTYGASDDDP